MRTLGLACALALALPSLSLAQDERRRPPPAPVASVAELDSLDWVRGIEWGDMNVMTHLSVVKQADGTYLASADGEDVKTPFKDVAVPAEEVEKLKAALTKMLSFPDDGFGGDGNHWYTELKAKGVAGEKPLAFERFFFDANSSRVMAQAGEFEAAVNALIAKLTPAPAAGLEAAASGLAGALGGQ